MRLKNPMRLLISLLILLTVLAPAAYLAVPHIKRWTRIHWLTSADLDERQHGLNYVAVHAGEDGRVLAAAVRRLGVDDETNFRQIAQALQAAGCWDRDKVTDGPWLRWIGLLAGELGVEPGSLAAQRLADLHDLADDPRVVGLLDGLIVSAEPDVRYNALCAAAELAMSAGNRSPYERMIAGRTSDTESLIARHAWIFSHHLGLSLDGAPAWLNQAVGPETRPPPADKRYALNQIRALLLSPEAPLRDVGCVLAVRDLQADELDDLITGLLRDMNDQAKMSGAILSGMTGLHGGLLQRRLDAETDWDTARVMSLGLWMQGDEPDGDGPPDAILAQIDLPPSTLILAQLHRQGPRGLEALLNPRGEPGQDLAGLLEDYGWWRVLNRYLPPNAPRWKAGPDPPSQGLQTDLLRDWYLVHRHRFMTE